MQQEVQETMTLQAISFRGAGEEDLRHAAGADLEERRQVDEPLRLALGQSARQAQQGRHDDGRHRHRRVRPMAVSQPL